MNDLHDVIKTIRLSEKATLLGEHHNRYVFVVDPKANKIEIRHAVEKLFGKKVVNVRTINMDGKHRRRGNAPAGTTKAFKKAIVQLKEGEKLDLT